MSVPGVGTVGVVSAMVTLIGVSCATSFAASTVAVSPPVSKFGSDDIDCVVWSMCGVPVSMVALAAGPHDGSTGLGVGVPHTSLPATSVGPGASWVMVYIKSPNPVLNSGGSVVPVSIG